MKKNELKRIAILIGVVIIVVVGIKVVQNFDKTKGDLKKLGYSKEEISIIIDKTSKESIIEILKLEYNANIDDILLNEYFIPSKLFDYIGFSKTEQNIDKVISKVNVNTNRDWYLDTKETNLKNQYSVLVNKYNYLNKDFKIDDLIKISDWYAYSGHQTREEVNNSYINMWKAAKNSNLTILVTSSYRTYEEQEKEFKKYGDKYASRPGYSEHQTGLALDISTYDTQGSAFKDTNEYKWLQENAHKYGFILRYPEGKEDITGYNYESWHYRYLGISLATKVYESELTYDEYYVYYCEYKGEC